MLGRVLCVEDDEILRDFITQGLREAGGVVDGVCGIAAFCERAREGGYDLWVMDRKVSDGDCIDMLRALRAEGLTTPALMLTSLGALEQRVDGFEAGADFPIIRG